MHFAQKTRTLEATIASEIRGISWQDKCKDVPVLN